MVWILSKSPSDLGFRVLRDQAAIGSTACHFTLNPSLALSAGTDKFHSLADFSTWRDEHCSSRDHPMEIDTDCFRWIEFLKSKVRGWKNGPNRFLEIGVCNDPTGSKGAPSSIPLRPWKPNPVLPRPCQHLHRKGRTPEPCTPLQSWKASQSLPRLSRHLHRRPRPAAAEGVPL